MCDFFKTHVFLLKLFVIRYSSFIIDYEIFSIFSYSYNSSKLPSE